MEDRQKARNMQLSAGGTVARLLLCLAAAAVTFTNPTIATRFDSWFGGANQIPFISSLSPNHQHPSSDFKPRTSEHEFQLRHVFHHGIHQYPDLHVRMDVEPGATIKTLDEDGTTQTMPSSFKAKSQDISIERLSDRRISRMQSIYYSARLSGGAPSIEDSEWSLDEVSAPNTTDKETVVNLAKMSWCAYVDEPGTGEWQDIGGGFNYSQSFGWEGNSLRGHIFADKDNSTIIVALKGTSPAVFDGAETTTNDKVNDNLFFGCCCGQGGQYLWHQVCDCMSSAYTCNRTCVVKALREENRYYTASLELYGNVTELYPNSQVWLAGHSLGGSTSSLLGLTFGVPVTTFEAPGEALAAARLGLPAPPGSHPSAPQSRQNTGAVHFGHTADPIFMGTCNAATSGCTLGGYSMQTECHTGTVCRYDTVEDMQWRVGIGYHRIRSVVQDVLEVYDDVPPCVPDEECIDCFNWKFFESNGSDTTTSSSSSSSSTSSLTRTTTCKTPGWWGCLDESTTTGGTTTTMVTTTSSSLPTPTTTITVTEAPSTSCLKYGWFGGCLETTTISATTKTSAVVIATSCAEHGWLGLGSCISNTTITIIPTPAPAIVVVTAPARAPTITTTRPLTSRPKEATLAVTVTKTVRHGNI